MQGLLCGWPAAAVLAGCAERAVTAVETFKPLGKAGVAQAVVARAVSANAAGGADAAARAASAAVDA